MEANVTTPDAARGLLSVVQDNLYTPVVGDVLDQMGYRRQFLPPDVRPIKDHMRMAGFAMPVQIAPAAGPHNKPFGLLTEALDQLEPGEVYVAHNGGVQCAAWGEILTAAASARGAVGAVVDGYSRDTPKVLEQHWPVFSRGAYAQDAGVRTSVVDFRCNIRLGAVDISPGDLIFGDVDGVVVVPKAVMEQVVDLALAKASAENTVRAAIEAGMSTTTAFATYGVL